MEKIERIVKDPELRGKLREGARKVVAMRDWDGIEKKIVKLYE